MKWVYCEKTSIFIIQARKLTGEKLPTRLISKIKEDRNAMKKN